MMIVGLTGGIGSGKSSVARFLMKHNVPVYDSDKCAKELMQSEKVKEKIIQIFGEESYKNNQLNRTYISSQVFSNKENLKKLNGIVHPAVFKDFDDWIRNQKSKYIVKEAAILFESGSYKDCDFIVSVIANRDQRIQWIKERSGLTEEQIENRMNNQWNDEQRIEHSDYIIENNSTLIELESKTLELHKILIKKSE